MTEIDSTSPPLVSILLPVYNEEKFIGETIESILEQDFENLEILISDNHSLDNTVHLCQEYACRDRRIKIFEQPSNIGALPNYNYLTKKAKGKYFMLAAGHDKWTSNYISANVEALESRPSAVLSYGTPYWIDENGEDCHQFSGWYDTRGLSVAARFFFVFWGKANPILGLFRRSKYPDLTGHNYVGSDNVILCLLALRGEFVHTVTSTFFRRQNRPSESHQERMKRYTSDDMKITTSYLTSVFPLIRMPIELCRAVLTSHLPVLGKLLLLITLLPAVPVKYLTERKKS